MSRRNRAPKGPSWPAWFYGPEGAKGIYHKEEDVPDGWKRKADAPEPDLEVQATEVLDHDALVTKLKELNIRIKPTWGDAHMKRIIDGDVSSAW
jgi:hypothetical protein